MIYTFEFMKIKIRISAETEREASGKLGELLESNKQPYMTEAALWRKVSNLYSL
jgi:hypothetical protein